ncbi:probable glucan endo-1,3-beta-glucosidase A6 [Hibiscus syriacus]|nr:probable glucan endo-1,3-beta-glucosidase A6 [Hibiscus syriacus]
MTGKIGINYGREGDDLPSPYKSIQIMKSMKVGQVKLNDSNPEILTLLSGTKIHVAVTVPNEEMIRIGSNETYAEQWVRNSFIPFYPNTLIRFVLVGNGVLNSDIDSDRIALYDSLLPAMRGIKKSLNNHDIRNVKVTTTLSMDVLQTTFPPSNGTFRSGISGTVMPRMLKFLNRTKSVLFLDVYPYFAWSANPKNISIDFALLRGNITQTDPGSGLVYTDLLDQMLDSVTFAIEKIGFRNIRLAISGTGWPSAGDIDQIGANIYNAATYNRNLIRKMTLNPLPGTPKSPGVVIPTFISSLYDENHKIGPGTERHWGLLHANGTPVYEIDLTGSRNMSDYKPLPPAENNEPYKGKVWCEVAPWVNEVSLPSAVSNVCGIDNQTCAALAPGGECYEPVSVVWHANYAFSSYWSKYRSQGAICSFNGLARETTVDPSRGRCNFPSVTL